MPTGSERLVWGFGDGSTLPVIDTEIGRVGAVICWESYMPLLRAAMYAKGIEIYCAPTADGRDTWWPTMQHVAIEGRCFVTAEIDRNEIAGARLDFDAVGHYARPDVFGLIVDETSRSPVTFRTTGPSPVSASVKATDE